MVPDTVFTEIEDTFFISADVRCLGASGGRIYFSDYKEGMVVLNPSYHIVERYANFGQGPGETAGASSFYVGENDSVYLVNEGKQAVELYAGGKHCKSIRFPAGVRLTSVTRFFAQGQAVYHPTVDPKAPLTSFDDAGEVRFWGQYTEQDDPDLWLHLERHAVRSDSCFFLIRTALPSMQQYTMDGRLIREYDLSGIAEVKQMIKAYRSQEQVPNSMFIVTQDACYDSGTVYLLIATEDNDKGYRCNTIAAIDTRALESHEPEVFYLPEKVYTTFCVSGGKLTAYNMGRAAIEVYTLPQ